MAIHLIGIYHNDHFGPERLSRALKTERPDHITLETSPEYLDYFTSGKMVSDMLKRLKQWDMNFPEVLSFIERTWVFEWRVPLEYSQIHSIPCTPIDDPEHARRIMETQKKVPKPPFLADLPGYDKEQDIAEGNSMYRQIEKCFATTGNGVLLAEQELTDTFRNGLAQGRDKYPAQRLRDTHEADQTKRIVHICGAAHALDDVLKQTLFAKIKDLGTTRRTLDSY